MLECKQSQFQQLFLIQGQTRTVTKCHIPPHRTAVISKKKKYIYHGSAKTAGKTTTFTKGIHFENSWNTVMVLVRYTFLWCDLSLSEVLRYLLYFGSYAPYKNPKLKFTKGNNSKNRWNSVMVSCTLHLSLMWSICVWSLKLLASIL